jgi:acetyl esterase
LFLLHPRGEPFYFPRRMIDIDKVGFHVGRAVLSLPKRWKRRIAGPEVRKDGAALDLDMQLVLTLRDRVKRKAESHRQSPAVLRARMHHEIVASSGPALPVGVVRDVQIRLEDPERSLSARHYIPAKTTPSTDPRPLLVYYHGGGMVFGDVDTHDRACRIFCATANVDVLSVEYRLAPNAKFPAAADDARAAFQWAVAEAERLGVDPTRISVAGDSAGGNLAAVVAQEAAADRVPPAAQILIYPAVDRAKHDYGSLELFAENFLLTRAEIGWYHEQYTAGTGVDDRDPRVSPMYAPSLEKLPAALVITAGFDPLRDEGEAYANRLRDAGNHVVLHRFGGLIHGFLNLVGISKSAEAAVEDLARRMVPFLHGHS